MHTWWLITYLSSRQSRQSTIIVGNYAVPSRSKNTWITLPTLWGGSSQNVGRNGSIYLLEFLLPHSHHVYLLLTLGILWERAEESNLSFFPAWFHLSYLIVLLDGVSEMDFLVSLTSIHKKDIQFYSGVLVESTNRILKFTKWHV